MDLRMVAFMRCLLALTALLIIYIDPLEPSRLQELTYGSLVGYCVYSIALFASTLLGHALVRRRLQPWADVLFYVYLVALTAGTNSIFFHGFFFAVLVASFSHGFREGLAVTIASAVLFTAVGLAAAPSGPAFELDRAVIRPILLLLLGYMIAYWGGQEISLRRRLNLLREVSRPANARLGADHAVGQYMARIASFFEARACLLIRTTHARRYRLYRVDAGGGHELRAPTELDERSADALLPPPPDWSIAWTLRRALPDEALQQQCRQLANLLEARSFASVPYTQTEGLPGRLYLLEPRSFGDGDVDFLRQVADQMSVAAGNVALVEEMMGDAVQLERARISRDIHDTTVQPYIGLKLGLEALHRVLPADSPALGRVGKLVEMANRAIDDVRDYVAGLRVDRDAGELLASVREQGERYRRYYGIDVEVRGQSPAQLSGKVAGEAFRMVCEALSNVHRHTPAKRAFVHLRRESDLLCVEVGNERDARSAKRSFMPRSIAERAAALGGRAEVRVDNDGHDVVLVEIPL